MTGAKDTSADSAPKACAVRRRSSRGTSRQGWSRPCGAYGAASGGGGKAGIRPSKDVGDRNGCFICDGLRGEVRGRGNGWHLGLGTGPLDRRGPSDPAGLCRSAVAPERYHRNADDDRCCRGVVHRRLKTRRIWYFWSRSARCWWVWQPTGRAPACPRTNGRYALTPSRNMLRPSRGKRSPGSFSDPTQFRMSRSALNLATSQRSRAISI